MIDITTIILFFGVPLSLVGIAWVAVWAHERKAPPVLESKATLGWADISDDGVSLQRTLSMVRNLFEQSREQEPRRPTEPADRPESPARTQQP
jgi:hypothetical protein